MHALFLRLSSLRFTVVLLLLSLMLVFAGTLAQVELGIYRSQQVYFESFFLWSELFGRTLPVLPAGYTIGTLLLVNLVSAFIVRFKVKGKHAGLLCVHSGLILLLLGEVLTDVLSVESQLRLVEGESKDYSESIFNYELAVARAIDSGQRVVAYDSQQLVEGAELSHAEMPLQLEVLKFWPNSMLRAQSTASPTQADSGIGAAVSVVALPLTGKLDERNVPTALVHCRVGGEDLGTYILSGHLGEADRIELANGMYAELSLRPQRYYMASTVHLDDFVREVYPGTNKPSHFESKLTLSGGELPADRKVAIYMNHPLRFDGKTFYQASFAGEETISILQVVQNPTWLLPYVSCLLITIGLCWQSLSRLKIRKGSAA